MRNVHSGHYWRCCCCPIFASQTYKCKIILTSNLKVTGTGSDQGTDWSALIWLIWITFLFSLQIWYVITKNARFKHKVTTVHTQTLEGSPQGGEKKRSIQDIHNKKNPKTKQVIKRDLTKCLWSLKTNYFSVFREPTAAQVKTDQSYQRTKAILVYCQFCFILFCTRTNYN